MNHDTTDREDVLAHAAPETAAGSRPQAAAGVGVAASPHRYPPLYQSMLAVSLLGSVYGLEDEADTISTLLEPTLPDPMPYRVNRALAQGLHGNAKKAEQTLQEIIDGNPDDDRTKVVLAVAKIFCGDPGWQTVLENVFATSTDPVARNAASNVVACLLQSKP